MKTWILIASIVVGLLIVSGVVMAITNNSEESEEYTEQTCPNYNTCSQQNNCGRATCGAVSGGSCGCGG